MKNLKNIVIGLIVILIGVLLLLKSFNIIEDFNIFFKGWWTLFIIVPAVIGLITDQDKTTDAIALLIGILLLLGARDIISYKTIGKLIVPIILIFLGLSIIFKDLFKSKVIKELDKINKTGDKNYTAIFSGQEYKLSNDEFQGGNTTAIFGGIDLDLRNIKFKEDILIKACCIFGGVDIILPDNVNVNIVSNSFFGGVEDKRKNNSESNKHTVYIEATCIFGGIDIK